MAGGLKTVLSLMTAVVVAACSGGAGSTGSVENSGPAKTSLRVEASDAEGDTLQYQWRVTAGSIENRNARETVWTMPDGPGLHFAYVVISDGKGGYVEQQYSVSTDALGTTAPTRQPVSREAPAIADFSGAPVRLRFNLKGAMNFAPSDGRAAGLRTVYLPDVQVQVQVVSSGLVVFSGVSDLSGEVSLPKLDAAQSYNIKCATTQGVVLNPCKSGYSPDTVASVVSISLPLSEERNLRLYGHVGLADGGICGIQNEFFGMQSAATVQLLQADGTSLGPAVRVNRFGDYAIDAAVAVKASLKLRVQCESYTTTLDVPAPASAPASPGYVSSAPVELSHQISNNRPRLVKMVANGQDGNVRGQVVELELHGAQSKELPGPDQFLTYKGKDTRLSACMYYRSLGAAGGCDAQGNMMAPISFDDWKRKNQFKPFAGNNTEVAANYINKMDLNLVRRMVATSINTSTSTAPDSIAFYVCNHPGPEGSTQTEIDQVIEKGMNDEKRVACVAMEWSKTPGVNVGVGVKDGVQFTKFLTFAPDGSLLPSINLDGRGEKYMPGACIACHGGTQYNGKFPGKDKDNPSPLLGARFLPFDTGNYLFSSRPALTEQAQGDALFSLNQLVRATEKTSVDLVDFPLCLGKSDPADPACTATTRLIDGWYPGHSKMLNKSYVPDKWSGIDDAKLYLGVIGSSCRTCHTAMGNKYDWDSQGPLVLKSLAETYVCGGKADIALNASMPNALVSRNGLAEHVKADPALAELMIKFFGCTPPGTAPDTDPAYPKR